MGAPLIVMAYSKKVIEKFENTLKNPSAFNVGRLDPKKKNVGTGMVLSLIHI